MAFLDWFRSSHREDARSIEQKIMDDVDPEYTELREKLLQIEEWLKIINKNQALSYINKAKLWHDSRTFRGSHQ